MTTHYGGLGVHFDVASAAGPQLHRILSALCPHYSRSLSAPFPQHLRNLSALLLLRSLSAPFPRHLRSRSALFPRYLRIVAAVLPLSSFSQELQYGYTAIMFRQVHLIEKTVAETLSDQSDVFSYGVVRYG